MKEIFGTERIAVEEEFLIVDGRRFPVVDDVIIALEPAKWPAALRERLPKGAAPGAPLADGFAEDIQFTFGEEWKAYSRILPEHEAEFHTYFDIVDLGALKSARVCDLGCGIGRWSYFLKDRCRELVLVDFSEAIFVARRNLTEARHAIFIMADIRSLPLKERSFDFMFCLGVLHHLPIDALQEVRRLGKLAPQFLVYLYYALDNRPFYFRFLLFLVTGTRLVFSRIKNAAFRSAFTCVVAVFVYLPLVKLGIFLERWGKSRLVPLYEAYKGKSLPRIKQDVYDRFFTRIEQRFSRQEILGLKDTFEEVVVSERGPYWHFLCKDHL